MLSVAFPRGELARELRNMIADGAFTLVTSKEIMAELYRGIHYPRILKQFKPSKDDIDDFIGMVMEKALIVRSSYSLQKASVDPTDDMFLACAMEAKADYIVSRDPHLRNLKHFHGVRIIDVKAFVEKVRKG
jgi:putative PIN family toxin of toxin-antitoxin system